LPEGIDDGAEKKLPLAQEPLPGSFCAGGFCCAEAGLTDALRSPLIHDFLGLGNPSASLFDGSLFFEESNNYCSFDYCNVD
jgi:hypothetical protein